MKHKEYRLCFCWCLNGVGMNTDNPFQTLNRLIPTLRAATVFITLSKTSELATELGLLPDGPTEDLFDHFLAVAYLEQEAKYIVAVRKLDRAFGSAVASGDGPAFLLHLSKRVSHWPELVKFYRYGAISEALYVGLTTLSHKEGLSR